MDRRTAHKTAAVKNIDGDLVFGKTRDAEKRK